MVFYHTTRRELLDSILAKGILCSLARIKGCVFLGADPHTWRCQGDVVLRVVVPDEKVVWFHNFNGDVLEFEEDVPPEWITVEREP